MYTSGFYFTSFCYISGDSRADIPFELTNTDITPKSKEEIEKITFSSVYLRHF